MTISNSNPIKPTLPNNASSFVPNEKSFLNEKFSDVDRYQENRFNASVLQKAEEEKAGQPRNRFEALAGRSQDPTNGNLSIASFWNAVHDAIDPDDLVGRFRRGEILLSELTGEEGQMVFAVIQDRISQMQAIVDALRGILESYNRAAMEAAKAIGR